MRRARKENVREQEIRGKGEGRKEQGNRKR